MDTEHRRSRRQGSVHCRLVSVTVPSPGDRALRRWRTRVARSSQAAGWCSALFPPQPDPLGEALRVLRTVRCGGYPWKVPEIEERPRRLGFEEVETFAPGSVSTLVVGRKPV